MPCLGKDSIEGSSVIGFTISLCSIVLDTDDLADSIARILGMSSTENLASRVQQDGRFVCRDDISLYESPGAVGPFVNISLAPRSDSHGTTCEYSGSTDDTNSSRNVRKLSVVNDERACQFAIAGLGGADKNGGVADHSVNDGQGSRSLRVLFSK